MIMRKDEEEANESMQQSSLHSIDAEKGREA
jgi:hypothetical protein